MQENVIEKVESFLAKTGMAPTTFGMKVSGNGHLVPRLRAGRPHRAKTLQKTLSFIEQAEIEHAKALDDALIEIRAHHGYVQIDIHGEPQNLPPLVPVPIFHALVESGQLAPSSDSFLGGRPQTYRPI